MAYTLHGDCHPMTRKLVSERSVMLPSVEQRGLTSSLLVTLAKFLRLCTGDSGLLGDPNIVKHLAAYVF